ncbi:MAG: stage II sporulation protein M [Fimbriimonadaceae bacterium]
MRITVPLNEEALIARRVAGWRRLEQLISRTAGGIHRLAGDEVIEFVRLYRSASSDLAYMRSHSSNRDMTAYLNALVGSAHSALHRRRSKSFIAAVDDAVRRGASTVRNSVWAIWLGIALFFGGAAFTYSLLSARPDLKETVIADEMRDNFESWKKGGFEQRTAGESIAMTSFYATNNPRAGVTTNALAVATFGLGTAYIEWTNGMLVGALASEMASVDKLGFLMVSLVPHGVSEIGGLCVTGAGGFVLGKAAIFPGRRRRGDALALAGVDAFYLLIVGLLMIAVAAPIEGFLSFNPTVPAWVKVVFGAATFLGWWAVFLRYGRSPKPSNSPSEIAAASESISEPVERSPVSGGI